MERIVTLAEREAAATERKRQAMCGLRPALAAYARSHGGRFLLFGSAARGTLRRDSDVDILTDFP
jgi:predicted nucleotidyltransferase